MDEFVQKLNNTVHKRQAQFTRQCLSLLTFKDLLVASTTADRNTLSLRNGKFAHVSKPVRQTLETFQSIIKTLDQLNAFIPENEQWQNRNMPALKQIVDILHDEQSPVAHH